MEVKLKARAAVTVPNNLSMQLAVQKNGSKAMVKTFISSLTKWFFCLSSYIVSRIHMDRTCTRISRRWLAGRSVDDQHFLFRRFLKKNPKGNETVAASEKILE